MFCDLLDEMVELPTDKLSSSMSLKNWKFSVSSISVQFLCSDAGFLLFGSELGFFSVVILFSKVDIFVWFDNFCLVLSFFNV